MVLITKLQEWIWTWKWVRIWDSKEIPCDWFENTSWMRIKWICDVGCIVDKNWIPGGTRGAVGTGQLHGVTARAYTPDRCIAPYLFNLCKLINKFQNLLFYCFDKYWNEYEYIAYIDMYQLVMI
jgi:hypothetical protein